MKLCFVALEVLTKFSRISLAWFGAWPSHQNKALSKFLFFTSVIIMIFSVIIPQGIKLFLVRSNLDAISQIISTAELPYLVALTKMSVLFYNKESLYC